MNESTVDPRGVPRRWSVALRASLALFAFLVLVVVVVLVFVRSDEKHVSFVHSLGWVRATVVLVTLLAIPCVAYAVIRSWVNEGRTSYRDVRSAWEAGVSALDAAGISFADVPVFLLVGFEGERAARSFFAATGIEFPVNGVPDRPAPLYVFAHDEGIFVCGTEVGGLSAFSALVERATQDLAMDTSGLADPQSGEDSQETALPSRPAPKASTAMRTIDVDVDAGGPPSLLPASVSVKTMRAPAGQVVGERRSVTLPAQEEILQARRLGDLCGLLQAAREPICPVNGLVVVLPMDDVLGESGELEQLQRLLRADVATVQEALQLRVPTTAVVTNCDRRAGFRELMRRVGRERCNRHRFGHRFNVRSLATYEALGDFTDQLAGVFEDWIYALFRQSDALTRPGNTRLHGLLCRVRSIMKERLANVLAGGLGDERDGRSSEAGTLFSGCYFCATGPREDRRAFAKGVVDKLVSEQEEVEWTPGAYRRDRWLYWATLSGTVLTGLLAVSAVVLYVVSR